MLGSRAAAHPPARKQAAARLRAIPAIGDDLGDHRVVIRGDFAVLLDARVDTDAVLRTGRAKHRARLRAETIIRIFRAKPRLDGMAAKRNLILPQGKRLACRDAQLPFHEIEARHHLGDRMLDLEPGVHFQEVDVQIRIRDELHGARVLVSDRPRRLDRVAGQLFAKGRGQNGAWRFLDDFLPPPLRGAIALEKVDDIAMGIAEDLHFKMAGMLDQPLQHEPVIAESALCLAPRSRKLVA